MKLIERRNKDRRAKPLKASCAFCDDKGYVCVKNGPDDYDKEVCQYCGDKNYEM